MSDFNMPSLGADMDEGEILAWKVKPGDSVRKGDVLLEVDTSKAAFDVEDGILGDGPGNGDEDHLTVNADLARADGLDSVAGAGAGDIDGDVLEGGCIALAVVDGRVEFDFDDRLAQRDTVLDLTDRHSPGDRGRLERFFAIPSPTAGSSDDGNDAGGHRNVGEKPGIHRSLPPRRVASASDGTG